MRLSAHMRALVVLCALVAVTGPAAARRHDPEKMPETAEAERARLYAVTDRWRRERAAK